MIRKVSVSLIATLTVGLMTLPSVASAQEALEKRENVRYYRVLHVNFKPGHNTDAWAILYGQIAPAVRAAGMDFVALDWESGPWDTTIYIALEDGYGTLEYADSPQNAKFMASLAEQEGGEEAAQAVFDEWIGHIDNTSEGVAHMHLPPPDDDE